MDEIYYKNIQDLIANSELAELKKIYLKEPWDQNEYDFEELYIKSEFPQL